MGPNDLLLGSCPRKKKNMSTQNKYMQMFRVASFIKVKRWKCFGLGKGE